MSQKITQQTSKAPTDISTATEGDDTLLGTLLDDKILGLAGHDVISGLVGKDTLDGGAGSDTLYGGSGDDMLDAGAVDEATSGIKDTLNGDKGNDTLLVKGFYEAGNYNGGDGNDWLDFSQSATATEDRRNTDKAGVKVDLSSAMASTYYLSASDFAPQDSNLLLNLTTIENVRGTDQGDLLIGDTNANVLDGGAGSDAINSGSGDDTLDGGALDVFSPGVIDTLNGDSGNDTLLFTGYYGQGNYSGGSGIDWLDFSQVDSNALQHRNTDGVGVKVDLASGIAYTHYQQALDYTWPDPNGRITLATIENVRGTGQADSLTGDSNVNLLDGGAGNDTLDGGENIDILQGGVGDDTYIVDVATDAVTESANAGNDTVETGISYSLGANLENLTLTGNAETTGTGNALDNILIGNSASTTLNGGAGNDTLDGGALDKDISGVINTLNGDAGNDTFLARGFWGAGNFDGGDGNDWLDYSQPDAFTAKYRNAHVAGVKVDLVGGNAFTYYRASDNEIGAEANVQTTLTGIENVRGSLQSDLLLGNDIANLLDGGAGSDVIKGGAGNDTLDGGVVDDFNPGTFDTLSGDSGNDIFLTRGFFAAGNYSGGDGSDWLDFSQPDTFTVDNRNSYGAGVRVDLAAGNAYTFYQMQGNLTWPDPLGQISINGFENIRGSGQGDSLSGDGNANQLDGGSGDDVLDGGQGADTLIGGAGNDNYSVDTSGDVITEADNAGNDTVQTTISYSLSDNLENITLMGSLSISGFGNSLDNQLIGNNVGNTLNGGAGNDTLDGGLLDDYSPGVGDVLNGDTGNDTFMSRDFFGADQYAGADGIDWLDFSQPDSYTAQRRGADQAGVNVDMTVGNAFTYYLMSTGFTWLDANGQITFSSVENIRGSAQSDSINGDDNANVLDGGALDDYSPGIIDTLTGNAGNDTFLARGFFGAGIYAGGEGVDLLDFSQADAYTAARRSTDSAGVKVDLASGIASTYYLAASNVTWLDPNGQISLTTIENVRGTDQGDMLTGDGIDNVLDGGVGNDVLDGGAGIDSLIGGLGDDAYRVDSTSDVISEQAYAGTETVIASVSYALGLNLENLTLTGVVTSYGYGNSLDNLLIGNSASNTLSGGDGNDTLEGGALDDYSPDVIDTLSGENGNDLFLSRGFFGAGYYSGGKNTDTVDFSQPDAYTVARRATDGAGVKVDLSLGNAYTYYLSVSNETWLDPNGQITLSSIESIRGTDQGDLLTGDSFDNALDGGAGHDVLNGGGGADHMTGGAGDDTYQIDQLNDVISEAENAGNDTVLVGISYTLADNLENLTLLGLSNINGYGNNVDNLLIGNPAANSLIGGVGNDTLDGGALDEFTAGAIDYLSGETGNDTFLLRGIYGAGNYDGGEGGDWLDFSQPDANTAVRRSAEGAGIKVDLVPGNAWGYYQKSDNSTLTDPNGAMVLSSIENIRGSDQNDLIIGNDNANVLDGGAGSDTLNGGSGNDTLDGGALDENIPGVSDSINGEAGDDTILARGFVGANNVNGGDGSDWLDFNQPDSFTARFRMDNNGGVKVDLTTNSAYTFYQSANDFTWPDPNGKIALLSIENIQGSPQADLLVGDSNANAFDGGAGSDVINGGLGNDTLDGGALDNSSPDVIDTLNGDLGDDTFLSRGFYGQVNCQGGGGADWVDFSQADAYTAERRSFEAAGVKVDLAVGMAYPYKALGEGLLSLMSIENVRGSAQDDNLAGDDNANVLDGGRGSDVIHGGSGNDTLEGGVLDELTQYLVDTLYGDAGDDTFIARGFFGAGHYDGGDGADKVDFSQGDAYTADRRSKEGAGVKVDLADSAASTYYLMANGFVWTDPSGQIAVTDIENILGTSQSDSLSGDNNANQIDGGAGNDVINGGSGNDTLDGGVLDYYSPGVADTLNGGVGNDTFLSRGFYGQGIYSGGDGIDWLDFSHPDTYTAGHRYSEAMGVNVDLAVGTAYTRYHQATNETWPDANGQITVSDIENVYGTEQADSLRGDGNANKLQGGAGNDTFYGAAGADTLIGGAGDDNYTVNNDSDVVTELPNEGIDTVQASINYTLSDNLENLTLIGSADITSTGNDLDNLLIGNGANNTLSGGNGNDTLDGGVLDDNIPGNVNILNGDAGNDTFKVYGFFGAGNYQGGEGNDWLDFSQADAYTEGRRNAEGAGVNVDLSANIAHTYYVDAANQFTWPDANGQIAVKSIENIRGTEQADKLMGDSNANILSGGAGNDRLIGGSGADIFQLTTTGNVDTIQDFSVVDDTLQLENAVFTALSKTGTLAAASLRMGAGATKALDADDYLIYNSTTGNLYYDADGSGANPAVTIAMIGLGLALTNNDFVVI